MTAPTRKLIGTLALLLFLIVYVFAAMVAAIILQVNGSRFAELAFYVIAGLLWVPVAGWLISWMHNKV